VWIGGRGPLSYRIVPFTAAYVRAEARGRGIGTALLAACVEWPRQGRYARLFVEHETANISGAGFWSRHFSPYLYVSMRYVDPTA
jgi:GNAT superfamily N-acetyltransferase